MADTAPQIIETAGTAARVRYTSGHELVTERDKVPAVCPVCSPQAPPKK